jgi:hypothetical protein
MRPATDDSRPVRRIIRQVRRLVLFQAYRTPTSLSLAVASPTPYPRPALNTLFLPLLLCLALVGLTAAVLVSVVRRAPEVFHDVAKAGAELEQLGREVGDGATEGIVSASNNPQFKSLVDTLNRCSAGIAELEAKQNDKQAEIATQIAAQDELSTRRAKEESAIESENKKIAVLGRSVNVNPGPPKQYDPGPEPTPPYWGLGPLKYASSQYRTNAIAWETAKQACDAANVAEAALHQIGLDSAVIAEKIAVLSQVRNEISKAAEAIRTQQEAVQEQLQAFAGDPKELMRWLKLKERREQLARSQAHRKVLATAFWLMDIPTLAACVAMTTTAILRLALLAEVYSPRSLIQR